MKKRFFSIEWAMDELKTLIRPSGAVIASSGTGSLSEYPHDYADFWPRDALYALEAPLALGDYDMVKRIMHAHHELFAKHIGKWPWQILHAKYQPDTFEEITPRWGHLQFDMWARYLFLIAQLEEYHIHTLRDTHDCEVLQKIIFALTALNYWKAPENGIWEDDWNIRASGVGPLARALQCLRETHLSRDARIIIPEELIAAGFATMNHLLPRESKFRGVDLAHITLIWPYRILPAHQAAATLESVETILRPASDNWGIIRYLGDDYYRSQDTGISASWLIGFSFMAHAFLALFEMTRDANHLAKAISYHELTKDRISEAGCFYELSWTDRAGKRLFERAPFAWLIGLVVSAEIKLTNAQRA